MSKTQSTYPTTIDSTLQVDRQAGDVITSASYDVIEDAIYQLETKVGITDSAVTDSIDYRVGAIEDDFAAGLFQYGVFPGLPTGWSTLTAMRLDPDLVTVGKESIAFTTGAKSPIGSSQNVFALATGLLNYGDNTPGEYEGYGVGIWNSSQAYGTGPTWSIATELYDSVGNSVLCGYELIVGRSASSTQVSIGMAVIADGDQQLTKAISIEQQDIGGATATWGKGIYAKQSAIGSDTADSFIEYNTVAGDALFRVKWDGDVIARGPSIDIRAYGAVSGAQSGAQINLAITAAYTAGGGIVFCPAGNYKIEVPVVLKNRVMLVGTRGSVTFTSDATMDSVIQTAAGVLTSNYSRGGIKGITINATGGPGKHSTYGVHLRDIQYSEFDNIEIVDPDQYGIYLEATATASLHSDNNIFRKIHVSGGVGGVHATGVSDGLGVKAVTQNVFEDCWIDSFTGDGIFFENYGDNNKFIACRSGGSLNSNAWRFGNSTGTGYSNGCTLVQCGASWSGTGKALIANDEVTIIELDTDYQFDDSAIGGLYKNTVTYIKSGSSLYDSTKFSNTMARPFSINPMGFVSVGSKVFNTNFNVHRKAAEVIGTDGNNYYCILAHTATEDDKPVTGINYATDWAAGGTDGGFWQVGLGYEQASTAYPNMEIGDETTSNRISMGWIPGSPGYGYLQGGVWGGTTRNISLQPGGGYVGIGKVPETILDISGSVVAGGVNINVSNTAAANIANRSGIWLYDYTATTPVLRGAGIIAAGFTTLDDATRVSVLEFYTQDAGIGVSMQIKGRKVGIGAVPNQLLTVSSSKTGEYITSITNTNATAGHGLKIQSTGAGVDTFLLDVTGNSGSTQALRILGTGYVGVMTATPAAPLTLQGKMRIQYDDSHWWDWEVGSGGDITFTPAGGDTIMDSNLSIIGGNTFGIRETGGDNTHYTTFATQVQSAHITYTLPATVTSGYYLKATAGTAPNWILSWAAGGSGSTSGITFVVPGTAVAGTAVAAEFIVTSALTITKAYAYVRTAATGVISTPITGKALVFDIDRSQDADTGETKTSGTLTIGSIYVITNYVSGDFTTVGGTNVTGSVFTATGTTPTWGGSTLVGPPTWTTIWSTQANRLSIANGYNYGTQTSFDTATFAEGDCLRLNIDYIGSTLPGSDIVVQLV